MAVENQKSNIWFKRKTYGWGWTPANKQGWIVMMLYVIFIIGGSFLINPETSLGHLAGFILYLLTCTGVLMYITIKHGESPKWQWGEKK